MIFPIVLLQEAKKAAIPCLDNGLGTELVSLVGRRYPSPAIKIIRTTPTDETVTRGRSTERKEKWVLNRTRFSRGFLSNSNWIVFVIRLPIEYQLGDSYANK
jgi:hypothetical protein